MNKIVRTPVIRAFHLLVSLMLSAGCSRCPEVNSIGSETISKVEQVNSEVNFGKLPIRDAQGLIQAVVEIPAGTNHKLEYDYTSNTFPCDQENGKDRVIQFLSYPGNYGFIPSTLMDKGRGGDGDALDVLILGEYQPTGSVIKIQPIGIIQLMDRGEVDDKLIAIPSDEHYQTIEANDIADLPESIKQIISTWFSSYKGPGKMEVKGWLGANEAHAAIEKWSVVH